MSGNLSLQLPLLLKQLRLPTVAANYAKLAKEAATTAQSYEEYLWVLLHQEANQRDINRRKRRLKEARFPLLYTLDTFDFTQVPSLDKQTVMLLAQGDYIQLHQNVALIGGIGTGKTHVATALGVAACEQGHRVRFFTAAALINQLLEAKQAHQLSRLEARLSKCQLLIIDEVGFLPFSPSEAQLLFALFSQRYQRASIVLTSNLPFSEWTDVFGEDPRLTSALLDRFTHHCHVLEFQTESYRFRQSQQQRASPEKMLSDDTTPNTEPK